MTTVHCALSSCSPMRHPITAVAQQIDRNEPSSVLCHSKKPRPGRRRQQSTVQNTAGRRWNASWMSTHGWLIVVLLNILSCCQSVEGRPNHGTHRLSRKTDLVFGKRVAPEPRIRLKPRKEHPQLHKREKKATGDDTQLITATNASDVSLPHPFDTSLGNNFTTSSCPTFFQNFLNSDDFNNCLPFSLLLQVH